MCGHVGKLNPSRWMTSLRMRILIVTYVVILYIYIYICRVLSVLHDTTHRTSCLRPRYERVTVATSASIPARELLLHGVTLMCERTQFPFLLQSQEMRIRSLQFNCCSGAIEMAKKSSAITTTSVCLMDTQKIQWTPFPYSAWNDAWF